MDSGIENSINGILERARYQRDNLLELSKKQKSGFLPLFFV